MRLQGQPVAEEPFEHLFKRIERGWNDPLLLTAILKELRLRPGPRARSIGDRISARLDELNRNAEASFGSEANRQEIAKLLQELSLTKYQIEVLRAKLRESRAMEERLASDMRELKKREPIGPESAKARVGLSEDAPRFVVRAAHTAYRKMFHPDRFPDEEKAAAEAKFKEFEAIFAEIYSGLGSDET